MRRRTLRNGMRLVTAALILIIIGSFYHSQLAGIFSLTLAVENRIYRLVIFWAAAIGCYGVVLASFGFVLPHEKNDESVRVLPSFLLVGGLIALFFYLLSSSFSVPDNSDHKRLRPGETITI